MSTSNPGPLAGAVAVCALGVLLAGWGSVPAAASPSSTPARSVIAGRATLLCSSSSPEFALLSVTASGATSSELVETHDFVHFVDVTPEVAAPPPASPAASLDLFENAACPSGQDLWVVASTDDTSEGWLLASTDGGRQWQANHQLWVGGGGHGSVAFPDDAHGFLFAGNIANNTLVFSRTTDSGSTWTTVRIPFDLLVGSAGAVPSFVNTTRGFTVETSLSVVPGSVVKSRLMETTDAGSTWAATSTPVSRDQGTLYEQPRFFGRNGILPAVVVSPTLKVDGTSHGSAHVVILKTTNAGRSWRAWPAAALVVPVELGREPYGPGVLAGAPSVSAASPSTVWIAGAGRNGRIHLRVTRDGGRSWTTPAAKGLPTVGRAAALPGGATQLVTVQAVTGRVALATLATPPGPVTYLTTDGGARWTAFSTG